MILRAHERRGRDARAKARLASKLESADKVPTIRSLGHWSGLGDELIGRKCEWIPLLGIQHRDMHMHHMI